MGQQQVRAQDCWLCHCSTATVLQGLDKPLLLGPHLRQLFRQHRIHTLYKLSSPLHHIQASACSRATGHHAAALRPFVCFKSDRCSRAAPSQGDLGGGKWKRWRAGNKLSHMAGAEEKVLFISSWHQHQGKKMKPCPRIRTGNTTIPSPRRTCKLLAPIYVLLPTHLHIAPSPVVLTTFLKT